MFARTLFFCLLVAYPAGTVILAPFLPKRRNPAHVVTPSTADTQPIPILPVTAIHGIPLNPLVKS